MTRTVCFASLFVVAVLCALPRAQRAYSQSAEPPPNKSDNLAADYAQACLELAEIEVKRAESMNRRVPNIVPHLRLEGLKRNVQLAQHQLRVAESYNNDVTNLVQLAFCEATAKDALERYRIAERARNQDPKAVSAFELESLRLKAKTTNLRYRMWKERSYVPSMVDQMQWQINRLTEQIVELNDRIAALESAR